MRVLVIALSVAAALTPFALGRSEHLYPNRPYLAEPVDRQAQTITVWVMDGTCFPARKNVEPPASRVERVEAYERPHAIVVSVWMRPERGVDSDDVCAGVGLPSFPVRVHLPSPLGDRALIASIGPYAPKSVMAAPRGPGAAGAFAAPEYLYDGHDCDRVAIYFRGDRTDWCSEG